MDKLLLSAIQKFGSAFKTEGSDPEKKDDQKLDLQSVGAGIANVSKSVTDFFTGSAATESKTAQETKTENKQEIENQSSRFFNSIVSGIVGFGKFIANPVGAITNYFSSRLVGNNFNLTEGLTSAFNWVKHQVSSFTDTITSLGQSFAYKQDREIEQRQREEQVRKDAEASLAKEYKAAPAAEPSSSQTSLQQTQNNPSLDDIKKSLASSSLMRSLISKYGHVLQGFEIGPLTTENQLISFLIRSKRLSGDELISILEKKGLSLSGVFDTLHRKGLDYKFTEAASLGLASGSTISATNFADELGKTHGILRSNPSTGNALRFSA